MKCVLTIHLLPPHKDASSMDAQISNYGINGETAKTKALFTLKCMAL